MNAYLAARPSAFWLAGLVWIAAWLGACNGGQQTVKCVTDMDCPVGQQCVGGVCQDIPEEPQPDEPDAGEEDGDGGIDGNDGNDGNDGDAQPDGDQGPDEDLRDFSHLNFSVAVRRGGTSGPANQCVHGVIPPADQGPVLGDIEAPTGHVLSGTFRDENGTGLPGALVSLLSDRPECLPEPAITDNGNFAFYLPAGGPYDIQAVAADGRAAHARVVSLQSNTTQDIQLPAPEPLHGGPLYLPPDNDVALQGWTVETWYHGQNKLAHAGVISGPVGFDVPLQVDTAYDWIAFPPQGIDMPRQVILEDACHLSDAIDCTNESDVQRAWVRVKPGYLLSGQASAGGTGAPQSVITIKNDTDPPLEASVEAGAGGNYQVKVPLGSWRLTAAPAPDAFGEGAMLFVVPQISIFQDTTQDAPMAIGQTVEFAGRLVDGGGGPVTDAQVRLIVNTAAMVEGSYDWCDSNPVQTGADGSFSVNCNLAP